MLVLVNTPQCGHWMYFRALFLVFIRALNPDERLDVDHVARRKVAQVPASSVSKFKEAGVGLPVRARLVLKVEAVFACGRSEEHTSELQSLAYLVCRLLLEK